ncbi:MAG: beta-N-acetylglucosaminidase domain-containing protein [Alloprevotella sp.]|nr:beta-N-acetylglucosaminidase domain-containing protein [Alloprevotella sp.]
MKKQILGVSFLLALLGSAPAAAQISLVNPVPQKVEVAAGELLDAPQAWSVKTDAGRAESFAVKALLLSSVKQDAKAPFTLTLGVKGDKSVKKYAKQVPARAEGYFLQITPQGAVIAAADEQGLFYGVQTLLASISEGKLQSCTLTDWPDVDFRGTVEGFYGTPWSHKARLSQIEFYGRNKMNVYIYGPKDDPYHRDHWREAYPDAEAKRIQELNEHAKLWGVNFYWAIHPGIDIKWTVEDRDALMAKLEKMYALGIRSFAVFFDDIWGEGTKADKQAELLNYVDDHFIATHKDVKPLIMCPTEYNRAWANDEKGYLRTLGTKMNKDIAIMWTGNTVVHCIDKESMEWINSRIDRKAYIWWNFPVSDFVRDHILLGPAYGNGLDIAGDMSGFVSNPMEHAEASKISLYGIADYCWNMKAYDADRDWEKGLQAVLPANKDALRTFALYNKDLGPNGHGFRREEGEELKPLTEKALAGDVKAVAELMQKCWELKISADVLLGDKSNPELIRELRPWLLQAKNVAEYGNAVCLMNLIHRTDYADGAITFEALYNQARSLQEQMYELENSSVRHALQPGIKVATKVLLPTANQLFTKAVDKYNAEKGTKLINTADYNPYKLSSDVKQLALLPVTVRGNEVSVTPALEVIQWQAGGSLLIECDRDITFAGMDFNLGVNDVAKHFKLEFFQNGAWRTVSLLHYSADDPVIHTGNELGGLTASKLRLTNVSGSDRQVYFKSFKFVKQ